MAVQIPHAKGQFLGEEHARQHSAVSCAKMAEAIEMSLGCGLWWAKGSLCYMGAYCRNLANTIEPSVCAAMRPYVKLL